MPSAHERRSERERERKKRIKKKIKNLRYKTRRTTLKKRTPLFTQLRNSIKRLTGKTKAVNISL